MSRSDGPNDARDVVAALGATVAAAPPADLRSRILAAAASRPRPAADPIDPRVLYRTRCGALHVLLASLTPADWARTAHPYAWSVHGLVAHLLQVERYTLAVVGAAPPWHGDEPDHLATGAAAIEAELARRPAETVDAWVSAVDTIDTHLTGDDWGPDTPAPLHGWPFSRSSMLVARAFEVWTHADDVCRATGRPAGPPSAAEIRTMSAFSVRSLPFLLGLERPGRALGPARLVLTGEGGGTFDLGPDGTDRSLLVTDVVEYCRVVARRITPGDLAAERHGDLALLEDLLVAAGAFAV